MLSNEILFTMTHINIVQQGIILVQKRGAWLIENPGRGISFPQTNGRITARK
jgi:hypothetical protein